MVPASARANPVPQSQEMLSTFKDYMQPYIKHHLSDEPDRDLPLAKIS
jgi:hypothetical protein